MYKNASVKATILTPKDQKKAVKAIPDFKKCLESVTVIEEEA